MDIDDSIGRTDPPSGARKPWVTPKIDDYDVVGATCDTDSVPGIDAFEGSNPAVYGS